MRCLLGFAAAASAAVMVCVAGSAGVAGCGGTTFTSASDAGGDGHGSSGSSSGGGSSSSGGSGGSGSSSGSSGGSGGSGGSGSGGGSGGSSGGGMSPCPQSPPNQGDTCMPNGVQCEYGTNPDPSCNQLVECLNGTWAGGGTGGICPVGMCPAHYVDVPQGQVCMPTGLDCAYAEGECNCSFTGPGGTMNMPTWHCFQPQGCPEPRPRLGSACKQDGQSCDYGACSGGIEVTCMGGYWQETAVPCPG